MSETTTPHLNLEATIFTIKQLEDMPHTVQVAMAGRSNVGKSSLINCLAGRKKGLAKISSTPGKTRSLNFYKVGGEEYHLVDLPGYGYARCSKKEREHWAKLVDRYFQQASDMLRAVAVLLDCRLEPQRLDRELTAYLASQGKAIIPVLTKADKCKQAVRSTRIKDWKALLPGSSPMLFSSKTNQGRNELWQRILDYAE